MMECPQCGLVIERGQRIRDTFLFPPELMELHLEECGEYEPTRTCASCVDGMRAGETCSNCAGWGKL